MRNEDKVQAKSQSLLMIRRGMTVGLPVVLGYFPVAITYGVLASQSGLTLTELTLMSVFVYAGASQFMAVNMISVGTGALEIVTATLILNFRHVIMNLSIMSRLNNLGIKWRAPLSLGITDETFAVSSLNTDEAKMEKGALFYVTIVLSAYLSWISGSFLGGLLGEVIPQRLSDSMGIALYAMFIALLVPSVKKELKIVLIIIIAMLINTISSQYLSSGWGIVLGTILGAFCGVFLLKEKRE